MKKSMLTTVDNPHSPFDDFKSWYSFDISSGYHTLEFLGRIVNSSFDLSNSDIALATEQAIDEIVRENVSGVHRKVTKDFPD
jgi:hypothetical protein